MNEIIPKQYYLSQNKSDYNNEGGHVGTQVEYLKFLNSQGIEFGDRGFFKLKNSEFLKCIFMGFIGMIMI